MDSTMPTSAYRPTIEPSREKMMPKMGSFLLLL